MDEHYNYHSSSRKASNRTCIFLDEIKDHQIHSKPTSSVPTAKELLPPTTPFALNHHENKAKAGEQKS